MNLPENHKRVSLVGGAIESGSSSISATPALLDNDYINPNAWAVVTDGGEAAAAAAEMGSAAPPSGLGTSSDGLSALQLATGGGALVQSKAAAAVTSANANLASDEYNFASVSMPQFFFYYFFLSLCLRIRLAICGGSY